jgi:hypothetical protein
MGREASGVNETESRGGGGMSTQQSSSERREQDRTRPKVVPVTQTPPTAEAQAAHDAINERIARVKKGS